MKILIAEDDAVSRAILERSVQKLGHECVSASGGEEAWDLYRKVPDVDAVISDWMMPGMDGVELCRRIRHSSNHRDYYPYFIFLTTLDDTGHLLTGMEAGADDYLTKPLNRDQFRARLVAAERVTALHKELARQRRELERLNAELFAQSRRDPLTGLGNRLRLKEDLEALTGRADRYGHRYSIAFCDVDYFKSYNDQYGHLAGDEVLRQVAEKLVGNLRSGDAAYRYGGEEFVMVLPEQYPGGGLAAAERVRHDVEAIAIEHQGRPHGGPEIITLSVGLATLNAGERKSAETLVREADLALYEAKRLGRNRVEVHADVTGRPNPA